MDFTAVFSNTFTVFFILSVENPKLLLDYNGIGYLLFWRLKDEFCRSCGILKNATKPIQKR